jgi:hypothetical protein
VVGQVQTDPFDRTRRNLGAQLSILAFDEASTVDLDPVEGRGEIHPVRTGVHSGSEVDDRVDPRRDRGADERVDQNGSDGNDPRAIRQGPGDS